MTQRENMPAPQRQNQSMAVPKPPEFERIGDALKRARETRGDDLGRIADYLCIRQVFLSAIEESRYDDLPADAYVIGFLRSYAGYLGMDGADAINRYRREMSGRRKKPALAMPTPITEGRAPSALIMIGAAVAALVIYMVWYGLSGAGRTAVNTAPPLRLPAAEAPVSGFSTVPPAFTVPALPPQAPGK